MGQSVKKPFLYIEMYFLLIIVEHHSSAVHNTKK